MPCHPRRPSRTATPRRPSLEALEDRSLLSGFSTGQAALPRFPSADGFVRPDSSPVAVGRGWNYGPPRADALGSWVVGNGGAFAGPPLAQAVVLRAGDRAFGPRDLSAQGVFAPPAFGSPDLPPRPFAAAGLEAHSPFREVLRSLLARPDTPGSGWLATPLRVVPPAGDVFPAPPPDPSQQAKVEAPAAPAEGMSYEAIRALGVPSRPEWANAFVSAQTDGPALQGSVEAVRGGSPVAPPSPRDDLSGRSVAGMKSHASGALAASLAAGLSASPAAGKASPDARPPAAADAEKGTVVAFAPPGGQTAGPALVTVTGSDPESRVAAFAAGGPGEAPHVEPAAPLPPGTVAEAGGPGADEVSPSVSRAAELIAAFSPFDRGTLEQSIDRFLDRVGVLDPGHARPGAPPGLIPNVIAGAVAACAAETLRRRLRDPRDEDAAADDGDDDVAFPGLPGRPGRWALEDR